MMSVDDPHVSRIGRAQAGRAARLLEIAEKTAPAATRQLAFTGATSVPFALGGIAPRVRAMLVAATGRHRRLLHAA
jgi:hypothetical protein